MRRKRLERLLGSLEAHPSPKSYLEQYTIPEGLAAKVLSLAAYTFNDLEGKVVYDLGCGTGRLAIGAALLGARQVVGVDIDLTAVKVAERNVLKLKVREAVDLVAGDIEALDGSCDVVVQNPPFGTKRRGADIVFLSKALEVGRVVYSLHKSVTDAYVRRFAEGRGALVTAIFTTEIEIPRLYEFHRRRKYSVAVNLYRFERPVARPRSA
ncbi:MAG: METTL5 family protein [Candidatus Bathyarchaeia archaeon]